MASHSRLVCWVVTIRDAERHVLLSLAFPRRADAQAYALLREAAGCPVSIREVEPPDRTLVEAARRISRANGYTLFEGFCIGAPDSISGPWHVGRLNDPPYCRGRGYARKSDAWIASAARAQGLDAYKDAGVPLEVRRAIALASLEIA